MTRLFNDFQYKKIRQKLRSNMSKPEQIFWYHLQNNNFFGIKFRRQFSIGNYIVDFYSFQKKLIIEIDGDSHFESDSAENYDKKRSEFFLSQGIKIIRFTNKEVTTNIMGCLEKLQEVLGIEGGE